MYNGFYDDLNFADFAVSPRTGFKCLLDELPPLHTASFEFRRICETGYRFSTIHSDYGCELEDLVLRYIPFRLEDLWSNDQIHLLIDYLGCPILCHIKLVSNYA